MAKFGTKQYWEQKPITIYWWNMRHKTLDYKGTLKGYLEKKDIKVSTVKHPFSKDTKGYRFKLGTGTTNCRLDIYDYYNYERCALEAIKHFSLILGDRTKIETERGEYNVNW